MCSWAYIERNSPNIGILFYLTTIVSDFLLARLIVKLRRAMNNVFATPDA
jgi:hypothetical protein